MNDKKIPKAVKEYQCPGCINGDICFALEQSGIGCGKHLSGTTASDIGRIFLGLPKGFNRTDMHGDTKVIIFESAKQQDKQWKYNKLNVPVWYYKKGKVTFVRGLQPRLNMPFIHIILSGEPIVSRAYEITDEFLKKID